MLLLLLLIIQPCTPSWTLRAGERIALQPAAASPYPPSSPLPLLDLCAAERWCALHGGKPSHLQAVYRSLFRHGGSLDAPSLQLAGLPRALSHQLSAAFTACASRVVGVVESTDGLKLLVELASGRRIETVLVLHEHASTGGRRCTVCVSSQVGCARQCSFCATGTMGAVAQLSAAEILEQVWLAREVLAARGERAELRNVVFMGMGEPLDNFAAVSHALRGLTHQSLFDLSARRITVSTVGASAARIRELADAAPRVRLALSLHAASQPLREQLIPSATACALPALAAALDYHALRAAEGCMVEYLLLRGVNDADEHADELARFCAARAAAVPPRAAGRARPGFVNLIPYNPTAAGALRGYEAPSEERVRTFHARLREVHGIHALIRWKSASGQDANGACGQLVVEQQPAARSQLA
ncbi:hypothetical protein AB1Y20_019865 [Prymnesium parvum]|uniref:Radical SAM core domain-containing protein n=1 Tax=Prymnesium parvum TaxID=97485 RepID=A0AB34JTI1_PRYPA